MHNGWDRSQAKLRTTRSLAWLDPHDAHTRALVIHTQVYHACHGANILHSRHGTALLSRGGCHTRWHSLANCNHRDSIASLPRLPRSEHPPQPPRKRQNLQELGALCLDLRVAGEAPHRSLAAPAHGDGACPSACTHR
jgi:hypothetical protein